tara:strand:+ start:2251 stop:2646 length:396 start_codon:yes stop_codon:yes gene_type:complete
LTKLSIPEEQQTRLSNNEPNATLASLAHWSFLITFVVPFANLIIPLVLYNTTGKEDLFVKANAKEALNFLLFVIIMGIVFALLVFVIIGIPLLLLLGLFTLVMPIIAAIQTMSASKGDAVYKYPIIFRLIS